jgi:hypothetical protein
LELILHCTVSVLPHLPLQYNVTVDGFSKWGTRTPGSNVLQLTTPALAGPTLSLASVRPTSPVRATATATPLPTGAFVQVHSRLEEEGKGRIKFVCDLPACRRPT